MTALELPPRPSSKPVVIAILMAMGLAAGRLLAGWYLPYLLALSTLLILLYLLMRLVPNLKLNTILCTIVLGGAWMTISASWWVLRYERLSDNDIATMVDATPILWRLRGTIITPPIIRTRERGAFARYSYRKPVTYFRMSAHRAILNNGKSVNLTGRILVHLNEADHQLRVGDDLEVYGRISAFPHAHNPGEYNRATLAEIQGLAGTLIIGTRNNLKITADRQTPTLHLWSSFLRWRDDIQGKTTDWLHQDIPERENKTPEALLAALLLGNRAPPLDDILQSFRNTGLAHVLAVSGLHLGILVITVLLFLRFFNPAPNYERFIIFALIALYLTVVPARIPVWRAGLMLIAFQLASFSGRKISAVSILAWTAVVLMIWKPSEITQPGFQLSFGNVFALLTLTKPMRRKLFGTYRDTETLSTGRYRTMFLEWCKTFTAAVPVPWLVSIPIIAYYFQSIPLIGIIATVIVSPFILIILSLGFLKVITALIFPSLSIILTPILLWSAATLINLVTHLEHLPYAVIIVPPPSLLWTVTTIAVIVYFIKRKPSERTPLRRITITCLQLITITFSLALWLYQPTLGSRVQPDSGFPDVTVTALSVGNGSCYIMQSGRQTVLFDAGSGSFFGAGETIISPALKQLGITTVTTIIISHGDIDHYNGATAVMKSFHTKQLIVPPQMIITAQQQSQGPVAFLLDYARKLEIRITPAARGFTFLLGNTRLNWLNPVSDQNYERSNNSSAVIRLETKSGKSMLFTGDIQSVAIKQLERDYTAQQLHADIMELPHHGGWSADSVSFVTTVNPEIILQSAGWSRMRNDRWEDILARKQRFITARSGAITCTISSDGKIAFKTFLK